MPKIQFRLKSVFVAVTVFGLILAPVAWWIHTTALQTRAAARLNSVGARVFYDYQLVNFEGRLAHDSDANPPNTVMVRLLGMNRTCKIAGVWSPKLRNNGNIVYQMSDSDIQLLSSLTDIRFLLIDSKSLTDHGVKVVERCPHLEDFSVNSPQITDTTMHRLVRHNHLTAISLSGTSVTDEGIHSLTKLPQLMVLSLSYTQITGESLRSIGQLDNLIELHLRGNDIGPGHMSQLKGLRNLKTLDVRETGVTDAEIVELDAALPDLMIYR